MFRTIFFFIGIVLALCGFIPGIIFYRQDFPGLMTIAVPLLCVSAISYAFATFMFLKERSLTSGILTGLMSTLMVGCIITLVTVPGFSDEALLIIGLSGAALAICAGVRDAPRLGRS